MASTASNDIGFSIRCPHCLAWSDFHSPPETVAISSFGEADRLLALLNTDNAADNAPLPLRCSNALGDCPAPFSAYVFSNATLAHQFANRVNGWALPHAFRIRSLDHQSLNPSCCGVIFYTAPLHRPQHILLEHLVSLTLLSRAAVGMSVEIGGPVSIYAATLSRDSREYIWIPVEAYGKHTMPVPPNYNPVCALCRELIVSPLLTQLHAGTREGTTAYPHCMCHASDESDLFDTASTLIHGLVAARSLQCPCYQSDRTFITAFEDKARSNTLTDNEAKIAPCWLGLHEIAAPIVVHDHLVAVAMTGQFITSDSALPPLSDIVRKYPLLTNNSTFLARYDAIAHIIATHGTPTDEYIPFVKTVTELNHIADLLLANTKRIARAATGRYATRRLRYEALFKQELLGRIHIDRAAHKPTLTTLQTLLARMSDFWAFGTCSLYAYLNDTADLVHVCSTATHTSATSHTSFVGSVSASYVRLAPQFVTLPISPNAANHPWLSEMAQRIQVHECDTWATNAVQGTSLVIVPFDSFVGIACFGNRDATNTSQFRSASSGMVSSLAQQVITDTVAEVLREFALCSAITESDTLVRSLVAGAISQSSVHDIKEPLRGIRETVFELLDYDLVREEPIVTETPRSVLRDIYASASRSIEQVDDIRAFLREKSPLRLEPVNLNRLIASAVDRCQGALRTSCVTIVQNLSPTPVIMGDARLISIALQNIVENAIKYAGDSRRVLVSSFCRDGSIVCVHWTTEGRTYPAHVMAFINRRPFEEKGLEHIRGAGLVIVRAIVQMHGGKVKLLNDLVNHNAMLELTIPAM